LHVHGTAKLIDLGGNVVVTVTIGIIVVVVLLLLLLVVLRGGLAAQAVGGNNTSLGVWDLHAGQLLEVTGLVGGGNGAGLILEESEAHITSLVGTVGSKVMGKLVGIIAIVHLVLRTLEVIFKREHVAVSILGLVVVVTIAIALGTHTGINAILLVAAAVAVHVARLVTLSVANVTVGRALVLRFLHLPGDVNLEELVHVNDVLSVVGRASHAEAIEARVSGAKAESNESLGSDAAIGSVEGGILVCVVVVLILFHLLLGRPLGDVMAAQELDGVVGYEADVGLLGVLLFDTTGLADEVTSEGGVGGDAVGLDLGEVGLHLGTDLGRDGGGGCRKGSEC